MLLYDSNNGPAKRMVNAKGEVHYVPQPPTPKRGSRMTEAEYNARGRAIRRRQHRAERGWLPYAKR